MTDYSSIESEDDFQRVLAEAEAEGEAVMAAADRDDERAAKQVRQVKAEREENVPVTKAEYLTDKFMESASETEKRLFGIYAHGASSPEQINAAIELARTNASEGAKVTSEAVTKEAEKKAEEIAAESYGVGPLANGAPAPKPDQDKEDIERIAKGGPDLARNLSEAIFRDDPVLGQYFQR